MDRTPGQKLALEMLKKSEAGETRADIAAADGSHAPASFVKNVNLRLFQ